MRCTIFQALPLAGKCKADFSSAALHSKSDLHVNLKLKAWIVALFGCTWAVPQLPENVESMDSFTQSLQWSGCSRFRSSSAFLRVSVLERFKLSDFFPASMNIRTKLGDANEDCVARWDLKTAKPMHCAEMEICCLLSTDYQTKWILVPVQIGLCELKSLEQAERWNKCTGRFTRSTCTAPAFMQHGSLRSQHPETDKTTIQLNFQRLLSFQIIAIFAFATTTSHSTKSEFEFKCRDADPDAEAIKKSYSYGYAYR